MIKRIKDVCLDALEKITPTLSEKNKILKLAEWIQSSTTAEAFKVISEVEVEVGGSVAKDTWLKEEADIDIFMLFPIALSKQRLGEIGLKIAKKVLKDHFYRERYAEHPYLEAFVDGVRINIVPCYKVEKGKWLSAADRTPFHTNYIKNRLNQVDLRDDIRLYKAFMKGIGVYGAEIKVGGFSGYLCELIVLTYQSFLKSLKASAEWQLEEVIDIENLYEGRVDEARRYFNAPLIVVDPVDVNRNVAAAVSEERLGEYIMASKFFLKNPDISYFYLEKTFPSSTPKFREKLLELNLDLVFIIFESKEIVPDILWGQLYKSLKAIKKLLIQNDFNVFKTSVWSNEKGKNIIILALETSDLPSTKRRIGPPIDSQEAIDFLDKHISKDITIGPWIEDNRWIVGVRRENINANSFLQKKLTKEVTDTGIAKKLISEIKSSVKILINEEILDIYSSDKEFAIFLTDFIKEKPKWLR